MLTCECGFTTYSGYLQEFEYLTQRRQWLWDRVVEQSGPPDPATARQYAVWPAPRQPVGPPPHRGSSAQILLVVLGICSWTAYSILAQKWFPPATPQLRRTWLTTVWALPWLFGFWALARLVGLVGQPNLSPAPLPVLQLMIAAVFCTALATVAWNTGVNRLGIQTGGMWQNTVPVFAVLIGLLFFGVQPLPEQILGGAIVLTGVLYMQWQRSPGRQKSPLPPPTAKH